MILIVCIEYGIAYRSECSRQNQHLIEKIKAWWITMPLFSTAAILEFRRTGISSGGDVDAG